jgi:transposase
MMSNSRMFDMPAALLLRPDFTSDDLRRLARQTRDANQTRRLLALACIYSGSSRSDAARVGGVGLQIVRDWVVRFNAHGPDGLIDRRAPGPSPRMSNTQRRALSAVVERGPIPAVHGVVRWRLVDLAQWMWEEFHISVSVQTISRELRGLGYRKLSARPRHHAQATDAIERFKKVSPPLWTKSRVRRASSPKQSRSGSPTRPG